MRDPVRLGIIGCGGFARYHLRTLTALDGLTVSALSDPSVDQLGQCTTEFPGLGACPQFADYQELLGSGQCDAVLICSPHTLHREQAEAAFAAGLHVLVEKPLACSVEDCLALITARDRSGKVGAVSYQRHGLPVFQHVRELVQSGRYGQVLGLNSHLTQQWLQLTKGTWRQRMSLSGGGQINDSGSHMVDILLWMTGLRAKRVSAMMDNRGAEVDIDSVVNIDFEGRAYGSLTIIGDACLWHERHHIWLERAALLIEEDTLNVIEEDGTKTTKSDWPKAVTPDENFLDAVSTGAPVLAPFECGLRTIELTEAAWRSAAADGAPMTVERAD